MTDQTIRTRVRSKMEPVIAIVTTFRDDTEVASKRVDLSMQEDRLWLLDVSKWATCNGCVVEVASPETLDAEK